MVADRKIKIGIISVVSFVVIFAVVVGYNENNINEMTNDFTDDVVTELILLQEMESAIAMIRASTLDLTTLHFAKNSLNEKDLDEITQIQLEKHRDIENAKFSFESTLNNYIVNIGLSENGTYEQELKFVNDLTAKWDDFLYIQRQLVETTESQQSEIPMNLLVELKNSETELANMLYNTKQYEVNELKEGKLQIKSIIETNQIILITGVLALSSAALIVGRFLSEKIALYKYGLMRLLNAESHEDLKSKLNKLTS